MLVEVQHCLDSCSDLCDDCLVERNYIASLASCSVDPWRDQLVDSVREPAVPAKAQFAVATDIVPLCRHQYPAV